MPANYEILKKTAQDVLETNDQGAFTVPAVGLYPHQWLWDSCFIAIGLSRLDVERAKSEILHLLKGQWANGMLPNMIFNPAPKYRADRQLWRSHVSPFAPEHIATSGITQPPMLAEAVFRIGQQLNLPERRSWYQTVYPALIRYHRWIYKERDPDNEGLAVCIHPYESGMDNSPPWIVELRSSAMPWWIKAAEKLGLESVLNIFRRDTRRIPPGQRMNTYEAVAYVFSAFRLRRKAYDINAILAKPKLVMQDLGFNCILMRANVLLEHLATQIGRELPADLRSSIKLNADGLDLLWDGYTSKYCSRSFRTKQLVQQPSITNLLTLYSGQISKERAEDIVKDLKDGSTYWLKHPVPSVPADSEYFDPIKYWQGPTWINANWMIIDGLVRYGFDKEADELKNKTLDLLKKSGFYEYFDPVQGTPQGAEGFSWSAALALDLMSHKHYSV